MNKLYESHPLVNLLGFILLFIDLQVHAQGAEMQPTPERVNQAVEETQKLCENQIAKDVVPGLAIAVVFQDQVVCAAGFGVRDVNTQEPVNADTVFQLASLSKPVGSTVVAKLVGERKISWQVGPKIQARSGFGIPCGWCQLIGQRSCQVDPFAACKRGI